MHAGEGAAGLSRNGLRSKRPGFPRAAQRVRGEEGETKEVTLATAFSENEEVLMLSKPSLRGAASQMSNV